MTDVLLSSFLSLFALFGKKEQVDKTWARTVLANYLCHYFGIRNMDNYIGFYDDLRSTYELMEDEIVDIQPIVTSICTELHGKIKPQESGLLLLRLMEFCNYQEGHTDSLFTVMADTLQIPAEQFQMYTDFVNNRPSNYVMLHQLEETSGILKTLMDPYTGMLLFTYKGDDTVKFNDLPVLSGCYQVWIQSSVLKGKTGKPVYHSTIMKAYREVNGKATPQYANVEYCGRDINFHFPNSNNGTHNLSFNLHGGELVAVMGGSGTGKSTLLSILNGSLRPQEGRITINGHDISEPAAKDLIGFVPQEDLLIEELTVYQNLWYTAKLCFEGMTDEALDKRVMKTLKDLGLDAAKDLKVGSAINKYISGGQRKRLNIALELIREPLVLFLDEPTSGLSSADTETVVNLLKEQTVKGKLIMANIHQPSSNVYKLFDRLWLLDKGGYPIYDGNPIDAITYFKKAAAYADADTSACPACGNVNPEIVLNIIEEKALSSSGEVSDTRKMAPEQWHELYLQKRTKQTEPAVSQIPPSDQRRPGALKQFAIFLLRNIKTKITNVQYLCITLLGAPLLALVCALLTRYSPPEGYSVMNNKNLVSYFFMAIIVATFTGMSGCAEEIIKDRALLKRESFLRLSYSSYIWSKIAWLACVSMLQTLLFILVGNHIMELHGLFFTWWLILFVTALLSGLIGLLLSQCLNSIVAIYISIPILLIPQILLCGLVVKFSDLTPDSTTGNVPLIGDIIPSRWAYEALAVTSFSDNRYEAPLFELDKQKFEAEYYYMGFLSELQSQLETMRNGQMLGKDVDPSHMITIKTNLPQLTDYCNIESYKGDGSYESLHQYFQKVDDILKARCNSNTLLADACVLRIISEIGKDALLELKSGHYNRSLEENVVGVDQQKMLDVVDGHIVPRMGIIYLTPTNSWGRAPFYSSEKMVGTWHIKTLWYNMSIMLLMCVVLASFLFADWPGRYLRK